MTTLEEQLSMSPDIVYAQSPKSPSSPFVPSMDDQQRGWEQAMGGPGFVHYHAEDISDVVGKGYVIDPRSGQGYGSSDRADDARKVQASYEAFARTHAGRSMITQMGMPVWDGYGVIDLPGNALAATISYSDGRKILAWNSKYLDRVEAGLIAGPHLEAAVMDAIQKYGHPFADGSVAKIADFYEATYHEGRHNHHGDQVFSRSREEEEGATYRETAEFYRGLAEQVKDSSYAMSRFYKAIADRSEAKGRIYGRTDGSADSLGVEGDSLESALGSVSSDATALHLQGDEHFSSDSLN